MNISRISIAVCTYKRSNLLTRLLSKIENQKNEDLFSYDVIIVDNDYQQSASKAVELYLKNSKLFIQYLVEPEQNIALARNKAIANATGEYIAFIDDDEFPEDQWLLNMYKALKKYKADGVLGPVLPYFEYKPPNWILKGRFFERPSHSNGYVLEWQNTRTGNVLFKKQIIEKSKIQFDPIYGSGGEDRDFFRRLINKGYRFVWSNEAKVYETVIESRCSRLIMLKRALLRGKMSLNSLQSNMSIILSIAAVGIYSICLPIFFIMGQHVFMKYLVKTCDHLGKLLAFVGIDLIKDKYVSG